MSADYRIEFSIQRRLSGEDDFTEIGFGSSGEWGSIDQADYMATATIANRHWETSGDMPDPSEADA